MWVNCWYQSPYTKMSLFIRTKTQTASSNNQYWYQSTNILRGHPRCWLYLWWVCLVLPAFLMLSLPYVYSSSLVMVNMFHGFALQKLSDPMSSFSCRTGRGSCFVLFVWSLIGGDQALGLQVDINKLVIGCSLFCPGNLFCTDGKIRNYEILSLM